MSTITLSTSTNRPLRPLLEAAIKNELRILDTAINRTREKLEEYEDTYGYDTEEFVKKYHKDCFSEKIEDLEWIGEHRMLKRLREKADALREVQIGD